MPDYKRAPCKITFVITGLNHGGAEMMLYKLLSMIDRERFSPTVISLMRRGSLDARVEHLGLIVHRLGIPRGKLSLKGFIRLVKILRAQQPDIIQGWMYHGFIAAQMAALFLKKKVPVLWNVRGTHTDLTKERLLTAAMIRLAGKLSFLPEKIINNSIESAKAHEVTMGYRTEKRVIIPNGFDTKTFCPSAVNRARFREEIDLSEKNFAIGLIARYHPVKDHTTFFHAAAVMAKHVPSVQFILAGEGIDEKNQDIMAQIDAMNLGQYIKLLGRRDDIAYIMAGLDLATLSSYSEGFPNVIGEAMSCAIPCVVTDVGDAAWIVGDAGLVVPPRNPEALAKGWCDIFTMDRESRLTMGMKARQRIIDHFSLASVVAQYEALYEAVLYNNERKKDS